MTDGKHASVLPRQANATYFSKTGGPFLDAYSFSWSKYITPTTVGTVHVTVDQAHNSTWSTTVYHTDYKVNGTDTLLSRTDTNVAGTVTGTASWVPGGPTITVSVDLLTPQLHPLLKNDYRMLIHNLVHIRPQCSTLRPILLGQLCYQCKTMNGYPEYIVLMAAKAPQQVIIRRPYPLQIRTPNPVTP